MLLRRSIVSTKDPSHRLPGLEVKCWHDTATIFPGPHNRPPKLCPPRTPYKLARLLASFPGFSPQSPALRGLPPHQPRQVRPRLRRPLLFSGSLPGLATSFAVVIGSPSLGERANHNSLQRRKHHGELKTTQSVSPKPTQTFRSGSVQAAVWQNIGENGPFYSALLTRSFRDAAGKWHTSSTFGERQIDDLMKVATEARQWMADHPLLQHN